MKRMSLILVLAFILGGCQSLYYNTMERFGVEKRDILVDRVEDARDSQVDAQEQFTDALEQFRAMVAFEGGELEDRYDELNREFRDSQNAAERIRDRVDGVEHVADRLFNEWEDELDQYENRDLRRDSQQKLQETRQRYSGVITAMRQAEDRLDPVLNTMQDQVLYLKHNLNARAIQGLRGEVDTINRDVDQLLRAMNEAIAEANSFIEDMRTEG